MIHIYYIILLTLTAFTTLHYSKWVARIKQYYTEKKHKRQDKLRDMIREEIKNILIELKK